VRRELVLFAAAAMWLPASSSVGQTAPVDSGPPGSELTVYLMTMAQGDAIWERFGHNAIGIRDRKANTDIVYNWGLFSFDQPGFLGRFLEGEMMYWMEGFAAAATVVDYVAANRTVEMQELNLSPAQRLALLEFVRWNAREENKFYRYDYFRDNCSTRVRDALDRVLGGAIRQATDVDTTSSSYRDHAMRLVAPDWLTTIGVDIGLGRPTDRPLTRWEEMFIPMKVRDYVRTIRVPDETGALVPLVTGERVVFQAERVPEREAPPSLVLPLLLVGLSLGGLLYWLGRRGMAGGRASASAATFLTVVWGIAIGGMGIALLYLRLMTQHVAAHDNTNVFVFNPLWLLVVALLPLASGGTAGRRALSGVATVAGGLTLLGVILVFVPGFTQDSLAVVLLAAPANLAIALVLLERTRPEVMTAPA